jgi:membrane-bound ClpP family serine protease
MTKKMYTKLQTYIITLRYVDKTFIEKTLKIISYAYLALLLLLW